MKKLVLISAILIFSNVLIAQITKGQKVIGGQLSIDFANRSTTAFNGKKLNNNNFAFSASPSFAILVSDAWAFGAGAGYTRNRRVQEEIIFDNGEIGTNEFLFENYRVSLFTQRYFKLSRSLFSKLQINANFNYSERENQRFDLPAPSSDVGRSLGLSASPGLGYFLNQHFALTLDWRALSYLYTPPQGELEQTSHDLSFDLNINSVFFGLEYFF